ncbi:MAG TPA: DUF3455 domain-containing protein [Burkholderiaceae bacterium]|nr:DUF3455 domain-containing protein [Burkholderiaceae bacterium]
MSRAKFRVVGARCAPIVAAALLASCASVPPEPGTSGASAADGAKQPEALRVEKPSLGFFSRIRTPDGQEPVLRLSARGVQVFRCEQRPGGPIWAFRLPEAELYNEQGQLVARHGANFSFEHTDGSRLVGAIAAHDEVGDDLFWLLISTKSFGNGALTGVRYVQRVNTKGGRPPGRCSASQLDRLLRVPFSAEFVFYKPQQDR